MRNGSVLYSGASAAAPKIFNLKMVLVENSKKKSQKRVKGRHIWYQNVLEGLQIQKMYGLLGV